MKSPVYNLSAKKIKEIRLKKEVFGLKINHNLVHQTMVALAANKRRSTAHTKTRREVRGGGRKPWRQKGTGNARAGSIRSPLFRGGAVTFGPSKEKNHRKKINKKMRQKAFLCSLSSKYKDDELRIIDNYKLEKPNTRKLVELIDNLKLKNNSILFASREKNDNLSKSLNNINKTTYRITADISSLDLLNHKYFFLDQDSINYLQEKYLGSKKKDDKKTVKSKKTEGKTEKNKVKKRVK
ncbi:MAG: 50S ribosomal protein L4 [Candidatus Moranbacteria bacterium]|nr:50S ribosomal protein L4 [Candidatus Moranbacteria bacterium]